MTSLGGRSAHRASARASALLLSGCLATAGGLAVPVAPARAADPAPLHLVKDIWPGESSSISTSTIALDGQVLFRADDGSHGGELWTSDGTAAGTTMVRDLDPGAPASDPLSFAPAVGRTFFSASTIASGLEPWVTDGTSAGTRILKDVVPGPASSNPAGFGISDDNRLFFGVSSADTETEDGLWVSDGTTAGTRRVAVPGLEKDGTFISAFAQLPGGRMIARVHDTTYGTEPWVTDGTVAGTKLLKDTNPGNEPFQNIPVLVGMGDWVLFLAMPPGESDSYRLWRTDGTPEGTFQISDVEVDTANGSPVRFGSRLIFMGSRPGEGYELWSTDGTGSGTTLVKDINPGPKGSWPNQFTVYGDAVYFAADTADAEELWSTRGTASSTRSVVRLKVRAVDDPGGPRVGYPGLQENPNGLGVVGGSLFFRGSQQPDLFEVWHTDGTTAGSFVVPAPAGVFLHRPLGKVGDRLLYVGSDQLHGEELWAQAIGPTLRSTSAPRLTGKRLVGSTLTSTVGTWSRAATYRRQWLRNGQPITGATGAGYILRTADVGATIAVRVTAQADLSTARATSAGAGPIRFPSQTRVSAGRNDRTVVLVIRVPSPAPGASPGRVRVQDGSRIIRRAGLVDGRVRVVLRGQAGRQHRYTVTYLGTTKIAGSRAIRYVFVP